jgi:hypothetical protein
VYRFFTRLGSDRREVFPQNVRELKINYALNQQESRYAFIESFDGELTFSGEDYQYLLAIEQNSNRCRAINFEIEKSCSGSYSIYKSGILRTVDGSWDLDNCTVSIKPIIKNDYSCFEERADNEVNFLEVPIVKTTVSHLMGTIEIFNYSATTYLLDDPSRFGGVSPSSLKWKCYKVEHFTSPLSTNFYYAREVFLNATSPGPEWTLVSSGKWVRFPILTDYTKLYVNNQSLASGNAPIRFFGGNLFAYNVFGANGDPGSFDNGMEVNGLLSYFANVYCGLRVKSNFLQLNPTDSFKSTYPALVDGLTEHNILFQKSDIKRASDINNATKAPYTFKKLLVSLCNIYNLWWKIDAGELIIEHSSWFVRQVTLDLTTGKYPKFNKRTRRYSYQTEKLPRYETFKFMEAGSPDFVGLPIEYPGDCASDKEGENKIETSIDRITTDLEYVMANSDPESQLVSDEGFFLMAARIYNGKLYTLTVEGILEDMHVNNALGWAFLHKTYFKWWRLQLNGYLNGNYTVFESSRPSKKRIPLSIPFCCDDAIDLNGKLNTDMGQALVGSAGYSLYQEDLELNLLYPDTVNQSCLTPLRFVFHHRDGNDFYFETLFISPGPYHSEVEATLPDGSTQVFYYSDDDNGVRLANFGVVEPGEYKFRKRVVCDSDYESPWTDYISVQTGSSTTVSCVAIPEPVVYIQRGSRPSLFIFRINEMIAYPNLEVQAEVTRPGAFATPYLVSTLSTYASSNHDLSVDINSAIPYLPTAAVPSGTYRFRFRRVCGVGSFTSFTDYVDVTI